MSRRHGILKAIKAGTVFMQRNIGKGGKKNMYPFVAIDFETANQNRSSACSVGMVRFDGSGKAADTFHQLIRPHPRFNYFNSANIWVHKITPADVSDAPEWDEVFPQVQEFIASDPLVAHNMAFDGYILSNLSDLYGLEQITNRRFCTVRLARKILAHKLKRKTLDRVFNYYFPDRTFTHHRADDDALACGMIFGRMLADFGVDQIEALCPQVGRRSPRKSAPSVPDPLGYKDLLQRYGNSNAFRGAHIAITGTLRRAKRAAVQELISALGGVADKSMTRRTDILLLGSATPTSEAVGSPASTKLVRASELGGSGGYIEVITEDEFFRRLADH